jgi:hypothetical protein
MDEYDRVFDILTEAMKTMAAEQISKEGMLPAVIDFTIAIALMVGGEAGGRAAIARMEGRIGDWLAGRFPAPNRKTTIQ